MIDDTVELLSRLVAIDSVNPSLVAGGAGEREIAAFVARWARGCGLDAKTLERTPGRPSVVVRARGAGQGRTLLLCGHLDTVTVEGMRDPHTPRVDGDRCTPRRSAAARSSRATRPCARSGSSVARFPGRRPR